MGEAMSSLLFQPPPPSRLKKSRLVWLETSTGNLIPTFYIRTPEASFTLLYSHANAEDLGNVYPWCKFLAKRLQVNLVAYDYTGYGLSEGTPSQENCFADICAVYEYIVGKLNVAPRNVILYGRSLGSGPSCYLAVKTQLEGLSVGGLILHAPFLSVYRIVIESGCTLVGDRFPNIDFVPYIRCPVFIIHGERDNIVPIRHSRQLLLALPESCRTKPLFIKDMGHNHVHDYIQPLFVARLRDFMKKNLTYDTVQQVKPTIRLTKSGSSIVPSGSSQGGPFSCRIVPVGANSFDEKERKSNVDAEKNRAFFSSSKIFKNIRKEKRITSNDPQ